MDRDQPLSGAAAPAQLPAKGKQLVFGTPELRFVENLEIETVGKLFFTRETTGIKKQQQRILGAER